MKRNNLHVGLMAFAMLLIGASCSDDDNTLSYSTGAVQNTELKTILVQRGYTFNEDGNLLLDAVWLTIRRRGPLRNADFHRRTGRTFHVPYS